MPSTEADRNVLPPSMLPPSVSRARVHLRTAEIAVRAGRIPPYVTQADYEQALREVTGEAEPEQQQARLDRAAPVPSTQNPPGLRPE